ncbi:ExeM/NucH family extracellular endonuclease [Ornithinimicrobium sp. F0845]|uniref:ExeM/NucH family extracellular endonuclease n=1 Tax=Ornithinimicrobium sp. F0845 TaxID=2926412 RepID=UPI001FF5166D|nr:ExeM/NucH family extracellular endonuclease [Ornithinimicrobium sp. F0845]MCK0111394.1 ExeM/NucH family extracellular endonuclease [Ornithinimicrobium sp. F0845]
MSRLTRRTRAVLAATASVAIAGALAPGAATALTPGATRVPAAPTPAAAAPAAAEDLFISEYVEGSSNNKAIEIYNGTNAAVDLQAGGYVLRLYSNGNSSFTSIPLTGTIEAGGVHVIANTGQTLIPVMVINQTSGALSHNGDDTYVLVKGEPATVVDSFGEVEFDPGSSWGTPPTITVDATLRRLPTICTGDTITDDDFDPAVEWAGFPQDTFNGLGLHYAECGAVEPQAPVINEFSISTTGVDVEFYEVYGEPETDYSHLAILQVEGDSSSALGNVDTVDPLGSTNSQGFWSLNLPSDRVENGTVTLLLVEGFADQVDLDADNDGVLDDDTGLTVLDSVSVHDGDAGDATYSETVLGVSYDGAAFAPGGASRIPDGADTDTTADWVRNDFNLAGIGGEGTPVPGQAWNTPGEPNEVYEEEPLPPGGECGDPATLIGEVQGEGDATPMPGPVTIEGIVVGDFQDGGFNGFYVQDGGDGNPATSDGVFVFAPGAAGVAVGDQVRVTSTAGEFEGQTQISGSPTIQVCAVGAELPEPTVLEFPMTDADKEAVEGMYVTFPADLSILEYFNYGRFGEVVVGTGLDTARQFQPTALAPPASAEAIAIRDHNATHGITIDDGLSSQNPPFLRHPAGGQFTLEHTFRGGDTITDLTGVMDYRFDLYRIQPTEDAVFTEANPRPTAVPDTGDSTMTVASFNVLNYFTTFNSRGANDQAEFDRQEVKIVAALAELDADVVGLIEIENNNDLAVQTLTAALNEAIGTDTYDYLETGTIGTDEITTALIFKPSTVTPVGDFATLTTVDDPRFLDDKNRPTLAQTFEENATGEQVTVAVNHLKSKGSDCLDVGDPTDPWAGNCNGVRTDAAEAMVDWLAGDPTGTGAENTLIIGDLNSYDKEDPINVFLEAGYSDLLLDHQGELEYSYVFDGQLGYLDYAMANEALSDKVTSTEAWKINADEPSVLDYDMTFKPDEQDALFEENAFRSSDHDPVLVGLALAGTVDPVVVDRLAGADRYATSANIAAEFGDVGTVYLASGQQFPDALTGTAPAVRDGAPVLLTRANGLPNAATAALESLQPEQVFVLGGEAAVSDDVLDETAALTGAAVVRISGVDRYATASALAQARFTAADVDTVYVASGLEFADSLAAGPLAGLEDDPIVLTKPGDLPNATIAAIEALNPDHIVVLGGSGAISDDVVTELEGHATTVERVHGEDRYGTAAAVASRIAPSETVFVASGQVFPDALSGAALAGLESSPLLLTKQDELPQVTGTALVEREPSTVTLFGGTVAIAEAVQTAIEALFLP